MLRKFDLSFHAGIEFNTRETYQLLMMQRAIVITWAARNWTNVQNKALMFRVSGHHFKGVVAITLNGKDLYDFHLINREHEVTYTENDIYFEDLVDAIDTKIEKISSYKW